jgi:hypothetical protein
MTQARLTHTRLLKISRTATDWFFDAPTLVFMEIQITDEAQKLLEKKGGTMSIDFIRPTG